jgi:hypothetical protein
MTIETQGCGDYAVATLNTNAKAPESMGIAGWYHVICRDADGNVKWEEEFPNIVVAVGKQLMLDTLLKGSSYTVVGPYLGLTKVSLTPLQNDTMTTLVSTNAAEFTNYTVGGSAVRGTAVFGSSTNGGQASPNNVVTSTATAITYTITGAGGTVYGCFLVTGSGASSTQSSTAGTLYSEGNFSTAKATTAGDTVTVTYSTTATS